MPVAEESAVLPMEARPCKLAAVMANPLFLVAILVHCYCQRCPIYHFAGYARIWRSRDCLFVRASDPDSSLLPAVTKHALPRARCVPISRDPSRPCRRRCCCIPAV